MPPRYDDLTPDQLRTRIAYCEQQIAKTKSVDRQLQMETQKQILEAQLRKAESLQRRVG